QAVISVDGEKMQQGQKWPACFLNLSDAKSEPIGNIFANRMNASGSRTMAELQIMQSAASAASLPSRAT
ncbi:hypothetical protein Tco_1206961, partial [Tanacetum coccineum]